MSTSDFVSALLVRYLRCSVRCCRDGYHVTHMRMTCLGEELLASGAGLILYQCEAISSIGYIVLALRLVLPSSAGAPNAVLKPMHAKFL